MVDWWRRNRLASERHQICQQTQKLRLARRMVIDWKLAPVCYPGEVMTDMNNAIYPDGFYQVRGHLADPHT